MKACMQCWRIRSLGVVLAVLACAAPARATVGGPKLLDVLGWSPAERRVYVHVVPTNEGYMFGDVLYFEIDGPDPERPMHAPGLRGGEGSAADSQLQGRLAALRERLVPLKPELGPALPVRISVVSADTARDHCFGVVRYRVRALWSGMGELEIDCFHRPDVAMKNVFRVPGRRVLLLLVSFIGDCSEGGYETQEPVLLAGPAAKTRHVPWRGTG